MMEDGAVSSPPTALQVHAIGLGHPEIRLGDAVITPASDRLFALAFQLCLRAGEYIVRDELVALFWGDAAPTKGRHSLRQMLYRLRQMGLPLFDAGDAVHLPEAAVYCDVREVLRDGWELEAPAEMVRAGGGRMIFGPLDTSEAYRDWHDALEARVRSQVRRAALRHLTAARREGRWRDLEDWALQVLRHDALNEEATLGLAESMVMQGSKARALELLDGYLRELGETADRIGLPARVLRKRIVGVGGEATPRTRKELIGRDGELRRALGFIQRQHDEVGPRHLLIQGAAGSGKSRMALEVADAAVMMGYTVLHAPMPPREQATKLSAVQSLCQQLLEAPGCAAVSPWAMEALRSICAGGTSSQFIGLPHPAATADSSLVVALSEALVAVSEECRTLLILEDAHNLVNTESSIPWRAALTNESSRLRILTTTRTIGTPALNGWLNAQRASVDILHLEPLDEASTITLASSLLAGTSYHDSATATRIAHKSAGNPLFTYMLAAHALSGGSLATLPASLEASLSAGLRALPEEAVLVAHHIKCLGPFARISTARMLTGISPVEYERVLSTLEYEGVLRLDAQGVLRVHECWADVLDSHRPKTVVAHQRLRVAEYLMTLGPESLTPEANLHAALLFHQAGDALQCFEALIRAGDSLYERGLVERALATFTDAADVATTPLLRAKALLRSSLCKQSAGDVAGAYATAVIGKAIVHDFTSEPSGTHLLLTAQAADTAWRTGHPFGALIETIVAQLADGRISPEARNQAAFFALRILFNDRRSPLLDDLVRSITLQSRTDAPTLFGDLSLLVLAAENGDADTVTRIDHRFAEPFDGSVPGFAHALALRYLSQALRWTGQYKRAVSVCSRAESLTQTHRLLNEASILAVQAGFLHLDVEDLDQAAVQLSQAFALSASLGASSERSTALWHLESRLNLQQGNYQVAYQLLRKHKSDILADVLLKRQCAAASMTAFAAAQMGDHSVADQMLRLALPVFESEPPSLQLDFPVELCARTLGVLKRDRESRTLADAYLTKRRSHFPIPLSPAVSLLSTRERASSEP